jgi:hypothetical protein
MKKIIKIIKDETLISYGEINNINFLTDSSFRQEKYVYICSLKTIGKKTINRTQLIY